MGSLSTCEFLFLVSPGIEPCRCRRCWNAALAQIFLFKKKQNQVFKPQPPPFSSPSHLSPPSSFFILFLSPSPSFLACLCLSPPVLCIWLPGHATWTALPSFLALPSPRHLSFSLSISSFLCVSLSNLPSFLSPSASLLSHELTLATWQFPRSTLSLERKHEAERFHLFTLKSLTLRELVLSIFTSQPPYGPPVPGLPSAGRAAPVREPHAGLGPCLACSA